MDVIRHIGLVNLRLGLGWAQNLWNPGFLTYVTAPVTVRATRGSLQPHILILEGHTVSFCAASCLHVLIAGRWSLGVGRCAQWFVPDVLAGAGLDVAANTLFLAPVRLHVSSFIHLFTSIDMYVCVSSS